MSDILLSANNIVKTFSIKGKNSHCVLNNITIEIKRNEITSLMGASGVGKSTLLYILGALDRPNSGDIVFHSITGNTLNYNNMNSDELSYLRNRYIGFVFQFHHLLPEFNILDNIIIPALIFGTPQDQAKQKAVDLMKKMNIEYIQNYKPNEISGGEQQRVAIARALINSPEIIFADEPTGNLDSENTKNVINLIKSINSELGTTFLIATHSEDVASMSNNIIRMQDGKIVKDIIK